MSISKAEFLEISEIIKTFIINSYNNRNNGYNNRSYNNNLSNGFSNENSTEENSHGKWETFKSLQKIAKLFSMKFLQKITFIFKNN